MYFSGETIFNPISHPICNVRVQASWGRKVKSQFVYRGLHRKTESDSPTDIAHNLFLFCFFLEQVQRIWNLGYCGWMINLQSTLKENKCKYNGYHWCGVFTDCILTSGGFFSFWCLGHPQHLVPFWSCHCGWPEGQPEAWACLPLSASPGPACCVLSSQSPFLLFPKCSQSHPSSGFCFNLPLGEGIDASSSYVYVSAQIPVPEGSSLAISCKVGHVPVTLSFRTAFQSQGCCLMLFTALITGSFICSSAYFSHVSSSQAMKVTVTETLWDGGKKVSLQYSLNVVKDSI